MVHVVALIREEGDGILGISFPDFPGCVSAADTLEDVIARGTTALAHHVRAKAETNEAFPALRTADDIRRTEDLTGAIIAAVPVDLPGRPVQIEITMDEYLLAALDRVARAKGISWSGKIAEAVRASLRA
jgi:predicted RNase H-like HicB family nuclease